MFLNIKVNLIFLQNDRLYRAYEQGYLPLWVEKMGGSNRPLKIVLFPVCSRLMEDPL